MRETQRESVMKVAELIKKAQEHMRQLVKQQEYATVLDLLSQCQQAAIQMGTAIEEAEGEGGITVKLLEEYCELIYDLYEIIQYGVNAYGLETVVGLFDELEEMIKKIFDSIETDISMRKTVVFLPYKASMWDSMESIWKAANEDSECDVYVVPIPYYDKNTDGTVREEHYEGGLFPAYVKVTHYNDYNLAEKHPEIAIIHNPYDDASFVTSVHPFFYSKNIKKYVDELVYVPYFVLPEINPEDETAVGEIEHFCTTPGVINSDKVIVQSENIRKIYINVLVKYTGEKTREYWESKISGTGSPKVDRVLAVKREELAIPKEWLELIKKPDGSWKKIVFYNNSVSALLNYSERMISKLKDVLSVFMKRQDEVVLLWRPHPLMKATLESMRPHLTEQYEHIVSAYKEGGWGIYDDTPDMDRAIALSDAYYGDPSSVLNLYRYLDKPIIYQNAGAIAENLHSLATDGVVSYKDAWWFMGMKDNILYSMDKKSWRAEGKVKLPWHKYNTGAQYGEIVEFLGKLFVVPWDRAEIFIYDIETEEFRLVKYRDERRKGNRLKDFSSTIRMDEDIYFIPYAYDKLVRMNMKTEELEQIKIPKQYMKENAGAYFGVAVKYKENSILIPDSKRGNVLQFYPKEKRWIFHETKKFQHGCAGIYRTEKGLCLVDGNASQIVLWDCVKDTYTEWENPCVSTCNLEDEQLKIIPYHEGICIFRCNDAQGIILRENEIEKLPSLDEVEDENEFWMPNIRISNIWSENDILYLVTLRRGVVYELSGDRWTIIKPTTEFEKCQVVEELRQTTDYIEVENVFEYIDRFIDRIEKKDRIVDDEQTEVVGEKIYRTL